MAERSLAKRAWYVYLRILCRLVSVIAFRIRCGGREHVPTTGGAMLLSNHQSHLDPILVGLTCNRRLNYVARRTLFRFAPFRWLIDSLDAIPIDRDGSGFGGIKETLKRLKRQEMVLLFPEGTRTRDGQIARLKPGFCSLARRGGAPIVPLALAGAFEAWPRTSPFPLPGVVHVEFGPPITPAEIEALDDDQLVAEVSRRMNECYERACVARLAAQS